MRTVGDIMKIKEVGKLLKEMLDAEVITFEEFCEIKDILLREKVRR